MNTLFRFISVGFVSLMFTSCANPGFSAKFIRKFFDKEGHKVNKALEKHISSDVSAVLDEHYDPNDKDAFLDVYYPSKIQESNEVHPTIVWIHGGAWIAGNKDQLSNYCKILAAKGYTVVAVNYSLAPKKTYPTPVIQVNTALAYLTKHAKRLHIDTSHFVLGGDSGGAHIAAQLANLTVVPSYANMLDISPSIKSEQLKGTLLFCGPYDASNVELNGPFGKFLKIVLWSYSGNKDFTSDPLFESASVINYVTKDFPPTFISVGNGDPLAPHSHDLAKKLSELGTPIDTLFWEKDYQPALPHEYQFNLDTEEGQQALERLGSFLKNIE